MDIKGQRPPETSIAAQAAGARQSSSERATASSPPSTPSPSSKDSVSWEPKTPETYNTTQASQSQKDEFKETISTGRSSRFNQQNSRLPRPGESKQAYLARFGMREDSESGTAFTEEYLTESGLNPLESIRTASDYHEALFGPLPGRAPAALQALQRMEARANAAKAELENARGTQTFQSHHASGSPPLHVPESEDKSNGRNKKA